MFFKLQLTEEENRELESRAYDAGLDKTAYIKKCMNLQATARNIFTVQYAVFLAKTKWPKGVPFTLSELYGHEWDGVPNGVAGVLGRNFYKYANREDSGFQLLEKKEISIGNQKRYQNQYVLL